LIALFLMDLIAIWQQATQEEPVDLASVVYGQPMHLLPGQPSDFRPVLGAAASDPEANRPVLQIDKTFYDLGRIGPTQPVSQVIPIRNRGTGALRITWGYTTCGCTTADLSAVEIPPGKTALLTVTFNPAVHNLQGVTVRRGVILETNDPQHPQPEFWIQATVK
jgi:hypothetical protein